MIETRFDALWDKTTGEPVPQGLDKITGLADVVVIGGGYTGLSTALHCAERGLSVQVLEARHLGFGGSGRNVGFVNAGVWHPPAKVRAALGPDYGPRFVQRFGDGPETVFNLIEKHQIRCDATRSGTIHAAHAPAGMRDLEARHAEWTRLGAPVTLLDRDAVAEYSGTQRFHGGLLDRRAGTINPMGYCRGLARAALGAGAQIRTGIKATRLSQADGLWRVDTDQGAIRGKAVVLGTNAYTDDLWPGLNRVFTPIYFFQLATEPLGQRAKNILPGGQGLWDTGTIMFSLRRDSEDRLIIGSMGSVIGTEVQGLSQRWARKRLHTLFPDLGPVQFEQAWHGQIAMTPDHLPRICQLEENLYTPIAYNGRGITTGTLFGQSMAEILTGGDPAELPLPITRPVSVAQTTLRARAYQLAFTANQFWKSL